MQALVHELSSLLHVAHLSTLVKIESHFVSSCAFRASQSRMISKTISACSHSFVALSKAFSELLSTALLAFKGIVESEEGDE